MLPPRHGPVSLLAFLLLAPLVACSSSDGAGPDLLDRLVGRWEATSMVVTSVDDPSISPDIVQEERFSASFMLIVRSDGSYEATLTYQGFPRTEVGSLEVSESTLTLHPEGESTSQATWSLTDDRLTLDGETTFDFNQDQVWEEEATLHLELVRA